VFRGTLMSSFSPAIRSDEGIKVIGPIPAQRCLLGKQHGKQGIQGVKPEATKLRGQRRASWPIRGDEVTSRLLIPRSKVRILHGPPFDSLRSLMVFDSPPSHRRSESNGGPSG
jgi:hypothetical protein